MTPRALAAMLVLACTTACSPPFTSVWQLTDFRILGVEVDPPQPAFGSTAQISVVTADPMMRSVSVVWFACPFAISLASSNRDTGGFSLPGSGCTPLFGPGVQATLQVPATGIGVDTNGEPAMTLFGYACAGGTISVSSGDDGGVAGPTCTGTATSPALGWLFTKTVPVYDPTSVDPPNTNPVIQAVRFGLPGSVVAITSTAPPTVSACTQGLDAGSCPTYNFAVDFSPSSREMYHTTDPTTHVTTVQTERLTTGYVVSAGRLAAGFRTDSDVTPMSDMEDDFNPPQMPMDATLYVYVADGRGGFAWTQRTVHVQ